METEAKFALDGSEALAAFAALTDLGDYQIDAGEKRVDGEVFFDTADGAVAAAGYYLRRRAADSGRVKITLKQIVAGAEGVLRREEVEAEVSPDLDLTAQPIPSRALRMKLRELIGKAALLPVLTLHQERVARVVRRDGREVAELSLDRVDPRDAPSWYELELEIKGEGSEDDLGGLVRELRAIADLKPESRSKFERASAAAQSSGTAVLMSASGELFDAGEREIHERWAVTGGFRARRARALLALDEGLTQIEAGQRAGFSDRQVRHWLARYREDGVAIYGGPPPKPEAEQQPGPEITAEVEQPTAAAEPEQSVAATVEAEKEQPAAKPKKRPDIDPLGTMTEAAVATLAFHFERMLEHEEGTRLGEDIEELHDMRVSTRRMRMALRVFSDYLDRETVRPIKKGLRRTGRVLGAVRDLDVFAEKTQHYIDSLPSERADEIDGLMEAWHGEREKQRAAMLTYLDGEKYQRFVANTRELLAQPAEHFAPETCGALRPQRVSQVLPGVLYQDLAAVWVFESQITGPETPLPTYHALRKACKGLRYTLEYFEGVLGSGARPLIKSVKGLQDHLGDLQDAVVTSGILRDYITWGEWRHEGHAMPDPVQVIVAPGAARYLASRQAEMEHLVATFPDVWPRVAGADFSRGLAKVIAEI